MHVFLENSQKGARGSVLNYSSCVTYRGFKYKL